MTFEAEYRSSLHQWHVAAYKEKKIQGEACTVDQTLAGTK
jgi:hypothetical protein